MIGLLDFESQLVLYKSYHQNCVNIWWHIVCVPLFLFGVTMLLTSFDPAGHLYAHCDAGMIFAVTLALWYTLIHGEVGAPVGMVWIGVAYAAKNFYVSLSTEQQTSYIRWLWFIYAFGCLGQMYGHIKHEGRTQSIKNNFLQTTGLSLLFVVFEAIFICGSKLELKKRVDSQAQALIAKYDTKHYKG